jgi:hypothetical protein
MQVGSRPGVLRHSVQATQKSSRTAQGRSLTPPVTTRQGRVEERRAERSGGDAFIIDGPLSALQFEFHTTDQPVVLHDA